MWQPAWLDDATIRKVLLIAAEEEMHDGEIIWIRGEKDQLRCFVLANDLFYWGAADGEQVTPENVDKLADAIKEVEAIVEYGGQHMGPAAIRGEGTGDASAEALLPEYARSAEASFRRGWAKGNAAIRRITRIRAMMGELNRAPPSV